MKLVLLLFCTAGLFLTSQALAKSKNTAKIVCKCNICLINGKAKGKNFNGYALHTPTNVKGHAYPLWSRKYVQGLLSTVHINAAEIAANCSSLKFNCQIMILKCDGKDYIPQALNPNKSTTQKPRMGPADPAPNPIIKTGIRLTIRKEDEGCV